jgi:hypothetical protein
MFQTGDYFVTTLGFTSGECAVCSRVLSWVRGYDHRKKLVGVKNKVTVSVVGSGSDVILNEVEIDCCGSGSGILDEYPRSVFREL